MDHFLGILCLSVFKSFVEAKLFKILGILLNICNYITNLCSRSDTKKINFTA